MKKGIERTCFVILAAMIMICVGSPVWSGDQPADNMEIALEKLKADKKLLVAANMELTESEAKGFWPVYEAYEKELGAINQRIVQLIESYANAYKGNSLTDEQAKALAGELVSIGKADSELPASYLSRLYEVLPPKKVIRYLQIENKLRAIVKYELAREVPLAP